MKRSILWCVPFILACGRGFYEAPPALPEYPERTPAKRWKEIFREVAPAPANAADATALFEACRTLSDRLPKLQEKQALAEIDALVIRNREGDFRLNVANFLLELRELVILKVPWTESKSLIDWRLERLSRPAGFFLAGPPVRWEASAEEVQKERVRFWQDFEVLQSGILREIEASSASVRPFWETQRAKMYFEKQDFAAATEVLEKLIADSPTHPRAETAYLLLARCSLEQTRTSRRALGADAEDNPAMLALWHRTYERFEAYRARYPEGKLLPDVAGWQAALYFDRGNLGDALSLQLERLERQSTREIRRSVLKECGLIFRSWTSRKRMAEGNDSDFPYVRMAEHADVTRLFVQHAIEPTFDGGSPEDWARRDGGDRLEPLLQRWYATARPVTSHALAAFGKAIVAQGARIQDPSTLLVLGWASLREKEPAQALAIFERGIQIKETDEFLFGRAQALVKLDRQEEAVAAYQRLFRDFPQSALSSLSIFDCAIARYRAGHAGDAWMDLWDLWHGGTGRDGTNDLQSGEEYRQWSDAIEQFAPLDQLASPLAELPADEPKAARLRAMIRGRALSAGNFDLARRYLDPLPEGESGGEAEPVTPVEPEPEPSDETPVIEAVVDVEEYSPWECQRWLRLDAKRWKSDVARIEEAAWKLASLPKGHADEARAHLELARLWKDARGRLSLPVQAASDMAYDESSKLDQLRLRNAAVLGISPERARRELDSRDELQHALDHFLAASEKSTDPAIAAEALEGANDALFRLAEYSLYRADRAIETDATSLSTRLVARLKKEFPSRPETLRAVPWSFTPPRLIARWMPGDYTSWRCADELLGSLFKGGDLILIESTGEREKANRALLQEVQGIAALQAEDLPGIRRVLVGLRKRFIAARGNLGKDQLNELVSLLDDFTLAAEVPGIDAETFRQYADLRVNPQPLPTAQDQWLPLAPFLAFLDLIRTEQVAEVNERIAAWEHYLTNFPKGPKSPAASLRLLRLKVRRTSPIPQIGPIAFPEAPIANGYKSVYTSPPLSPELAKELADDLAEHEERFPGGRYAADISVLRAAVAIGSGQPDVALRELCRVLGDKQHPELQPDAAFYFADCGWRLLDPEQRPAYAAAFRAQPESLKYLRSLVEGDTCLSRLRPILPWLEGK